MTFKLLEDSDDKDVLYVDPDDKVIINGFVADVYMSLVLIVEYDLGTPVSRETHYNSYAMMKSTSWVNGRTITSFTVGATIFIPFNGERLLLQNTDRISINDDDDSLNIELELRSDEICMILGAKPLIFENIEDKSSSKPREIDSMNRLSLKAADKNDSSKVTIHQQQQEQQSNDGEYKTMIGFDLVVIHPKKGPLAHEQNMLEVLAEDNNRRLGQADSEDGGDGTRPNFRGKDDDKGIDDRNKKEKDEKGHSDSEEDNKKLKAQSTKGFSVTKQDVVKTLSSSKDKNKIKGKAYDDGDDDDIQSIADSIVAGDSENSSLRLDALYYTSVGYSKDVNKFEWDVVSEKSSQFGGGIYPDRLDREAYRGIGFYAPNDRNSLLAQSLQLKLISQDHSGMTMLKDRSELMRGGVRDNDRSNINQNELLRIAPKTIVSINSNTSHMRDITRGAKSRLSRYGIDSALIDTPLEAILGSNSHNIDDNRRNNNSSSKGKNIVVDIDLEARDELNLHEINIQFAGYRAGSKVVVNNNNNNNNTSSTTNDIQSMKHFEYQPKAIFFSFQFYSCMPTRTEVMRLIPADDGQICVLARDEAYARDDPPLSLRYLIDCSTASPHEAIEFAEYLATCSLYIDIFDADSLLHIGTCGIPLRRLMRQGQITMKMAVECDVINAELMSCQGQSDLNSNVIADGGPMEGLIVGAVQLILTNYGQHGSNSSNNSNSNTGPMKVKQVKNDFNNEDNHVDEMNWRAFGIQKNINNNKQQQQQQQLYVSSNRPRNSVRAKPLSESAPELSKALSDVRHSSTSDGQQYSGASLRSLTTTRGDPGLCTLTYDEVAIIFRRFRGPLKGTCQYAGDLLTLLDMPSLSIALKKLVHAYSAFGDYEGLMKVITIVTKVIIIFYL